MTTTIELAFAALTMISTAIVIFKVQQENQKSYVPIKIKVKKKQK